MILSLTTVLGHTEQALEVRTRQHTECEVEIKRLKSNIVRLSSELKVTNEGRLELTSQLQHSKAEVQGKQQMVEALQAAETRCSSLETALRQAREEHVREKRVLEMKVCY